jgi:hypothetical protein
LEYRRGIMAMRHNLPLVGDDKLTAISLLHLGIVLRPIGILLCLDLLRAQWSDPHLCSQVTLDALQVRSHVGFTARVWDNW